MNVKIVFVKPDGTEIPYEAMTDEEKKEQAKALTKRFMAGLGYVEKQKNA